MNKQATVKEREDALKEMGLDLIFKRLPFNKDIDTKIGSIDFKVTLLKNGKKVLDTEFHKGLGHFQEDLKILKEKGLRDSHFAFKGREVLNSINYAIKQIQYTELMLKTVPEKVLNKYFAHCQCFCVSRIELAYTLCLDATSTTFENWCNEFDYDYDSRSAKKLYDECLKIFLQLHSAGVDIEKLRNICDGY